MHINFGITVPRFCSGNEVSCQTCVEIVFHHSVVYVHSIYFLQVVSNVLIVSLGPASLAVQTPEGLDGWSLLFYILRINYTQLTILLDVLGHVVFSTPQIVWNLSNRFKVLSPPASPVVW